MGPNFGEIFHESHGVIIILVDLVGRKTLEASVFIEGDIVNKVRTSSTEITENTTAPNIT